jgi:hypothetical protein
MPMIDVYAAAGTFSDPHQLAQDLAGAVMRWEQVPEIPLFADNTAAFIHDLSADAISTASGAGNYVRVQVLTPAGVLDRDKQLGVVASRSGTPTAKATEIRRCCCSTPGPRACPRGRRSGRVSLRRHDWSPSICLSSLDGDGGLVWGFYRGSWVTQELCPPT